MDFFATQYRTSHSRIDIDDVPNTANEEAIAPTMEGSNVSPGNGAESRGSKRRYIDREESTKEEKDSGSNPTQGKDDDNPHNFVNEDRREAVHLMRSLNHCRVHQMTEDYVDFASNLMLAPITRLDGSNPQLPISAISALAYLKSSRRQPLIVERWSPLEIALFEAAIVQHGKQFHLVQKAVETKSTRDIIDFYYVWKKTSHYRMWKKQYLPPHLDVSDDEPATRK